MTQQYLVKKKSRAIRKCADLSYYEEIKMDTTPVSASSGCYTHFAFPPPPQKSLRPMSASSHCHSVSDSDSQSESGACLSQSSPIACRYPLFAFRGYQSEGSPVSLHSVPRLLPPIGVFWDIENCRVPKGRSAVAVAQVIRDKFFTGYREAEFLVVCDVKKENNQVIQELNDAQVNLIHVASTCKNAADEKLRQSIRRFAEIYGSPAAIILISGDINFAADINDLRHRKKIHVILLHQSNTSEALILCASEHYNFSELVESLPPRSIKSCNKPMEVVVSNLPEDVDPARLKARLKQLSDNCGGRVGNIIKNCATIRFSSVDAANRAQKRMEGEDVFGRKISVSYPSSVLDKEKHDGSPLKSYSNSAQARRVRNILKDDESVSNTAIAPNYGLCQSTPAYLNLLGATNTVQSTRNGWTNSGLYNASILYNHENYQPYDQIPGSDLLTNSKDNSRNHSPFSGWHPSSSKSPPPPLEERKPLGYGCSSNASERTPEGFRRIRGTHKANGTAALWEQSSVENIHKPVAQQIGPMTLSSLNLADIQDAKWLRSQGSGSTLNRNSKTPSPFVCHSSSNEFQAVNTSSKGALRSRTPTPVSRSSASPFNQLYDADSEESEHFFHPIPNASKVVQNGSHSNDPVELQVTNLDSGIGAKNIKRILLSLFREHVMVMNVSILTQSDGSLSALVKVPTSWDAQFAVSKLQRRKIGFKKINISRTNTSGPSPQVLRSQILTLLMEVPGHCLPLIKFRELFESRYLSSVTMSDIFKMKDVCFVTEGPSGRMITLNSEQRNTPSPLMPPLVQDVQAAELPYCPFHTYEPQPDKGWAEQKIASLPYVRIGLKILSIRIHSLLHSHNGSLHLHSLPICYKSQFEPLSEEENGVALEHLVNCLPGVEIYQNPSCIKYVRWLKAKPVGETAGSEPATCISPPLAGPLAQFSRELIDLLKTLPRCQLPFSHFIPAYHHHFGRQCRVADYGFTKLLELFEALPHVVQVMGEGNKRVITLSHRVQIKRFTSDLLRVLKLQASKQVALSEFPLVYQRVLNRPWKVEDYGVCELQDMLAEVSDATVMVSVKDDDIHISIPKREQTPEEVQRTKEFAAVVVEVLRHAPNCSMLFNKFIPAHHLHFGRQCRTADYGFTKLVELFEAIPDVVKVDKRFEILISLLQMPIMGDCYKNCQVEMLNGERHVTLTIKERLKVLADQIASLLQSSSQPFLALSAIPTAYLHQYGHALCPETFDCSNMEELMELVPNTVELLPSPNGPVAHLLLQSDKQCIQALLLKAPNHKMELSHLLEVLHQHYNRTATLTEIKKLSIVQVTETGDEIMVNLHPLHMFAYNMQQLLLHYGGQLPMNMVENRYLQFYGTVCQPACYGYNSLGSLLRAIPETVQLRGRGNRCIVLLKKKLAATSDKLSLHSAHTVTSRSNTCDMDMSRNNETGNASGVDAGSSASGPQSLDGRSSASGMLENRPNESCEGCEMAKTIEPDTPKKSTKYSPGTPPASPNLVLSPSALLLSPSSNLLPAYPGPQKYFPPHVVSPEPSELPLPQLTSGTLTFKNGVTPLEDTSTSDGVPMEKGNSSLSAPGDSSNSTPSRNRRKRRLAAQFNTPIDLP